MTALAEITVLLVDDEPIVRSFFQRALRSRGFQVIAAKDGREAIEIFKREHEAIGCVLLDFMMPGMDGEATFYELRRIASSVPVILLSAFLPDDVLDRLNSAGLCGYIQKPLEDDTLISEVRRIVARE